MKCQKLMAMSTAMTNEDDRTVSHRVELCNLAEMLITALSFVSRRHMG